MVKSGYGDWVVRVLDLAGIFHPPLVNIAEESMFSLMLYLLNLICLLLKARHKQNLYIRPADNFLSPIKQPLSLGVVCQGQEVSTLRPKTVHHSGKIRAQCVYFQNTPVKMICNKYFPENISRTSLQFTKG